MWYLFKVIKAILSRWYVRLVIYFVFVSGSLYILARAENTTLYEYLKYIPGYIFSLGGNFALVGLVVGEISKQLEQYAGVRENQIRSFVWLSQAVGLLEATLYTSSWLIGYPQFIGLWLGLKVAAQWTRWGQGYIEGQREVPGRTLYNTYLIGSGLSVVYGVTGGLIVNWLWWGTDKIWPAVIPVSYTIALGTLGFWAFVRHRIDRGQLK